MWSRGLAKYTQKSLCNMVRIVYAIIDFETCGVAIIKQKLNEHAYMYSLLSHIFKIFYNEPNIPCQVCFGSMRNSTLFMYLEIHKQILNHNNLATIIQQYQRVTIYDLNLNHFLIMNHQIFISHAQREESHMFSKWRLLTQVN